MMDRYDHLNLIQNKLDSEVESDDDSADSRQETSKIEDSEISITNNKKNKFSLLENANLYKNHHRNIELSTNTNSSSSIKYKVPAIFDQFFIYFDKVEMTRKMDKIDIDFTPNGGIGYVLTANSNVNKSKFTSSEVQASPNSIFRSNLQTNSDRPSATDSVQ